MPLIASIVCVMRLYLVALRFSLFPLWPVDKADLRQEYGDLVVKGGGGYAPIISILPS